jgi:hypothetical protein
MLVNFDHQSVGPRYESFGIHCIIRGDHHRRKTYPPKAAGKWRSLLLPAALANFQQSNKSMHDEVL